MTRSGKTLPVLILLLLAPAFLFPWPGRPAIAAAGEDRIAAFRGDGGAAVSTRAPRRRAQIPAASVPLRALPASPSPVFVPGFRRIAAAFHDRTPVSLVPSSGAGVTRAGPVLPG